MFVVMSKFVVANGMSEETRKAFLARPRLVENHIGFIRMETMNPIDQPDEFWLITYWQDQQSWQAWYKSHTFKESHSGIPKGLKLAPKQTEIKYFHVISQ